ncbi:hypothetical protein L218DRAFT_1006272 [Marasmius fiardii PR-910]|nr:hypothetical protein L218DRAFT_1006272 [Marasmius fiardii PR-910]
MFGTETKRILCPGSLIALSVLVNVGALVSVIVTATDFRRRTATGLLVLTIEKYVTNGCIGLSTLINFALTSVLAGRIWWLSRRSRMGHNKVSERFGFVWVILLESGLLYLLGLAVYLVGNFAEAYDAGSVLIQIGGITPTLIVVRANPNSSGSGDSGTGSEDRDDSNVMSMLLRGRRFRQAGSIFRYPIYQN